MRTPPPGRLLLAGLAVILAAGAAGPGAPPLKGMRWLAPGVSPAKALTYRPVECLALPSDPEEAYRVELGRAAFRTPLLLGGQAARAGVACETCHRNGRANADFDFPGISGAPGTADVTSSLFSSHRGDGVDNPRPIPDLGGPRDRLKVSQAREGRALETFIHGLVVQEFDGAEPPPAVLDGLAAYVRAMGPAACAAAGTEPVTLEGDLEDARRAVRAAQAALGRGDRPSASLMVEAARSQLGAVSERFADPALAPERRLLAAADRDLSTVLTEIRAAGPAPAADADDAMDPGAAALDAWLERSELWGAALGRRERLSLYEPAQLERLPVTARPAAAN